MATLSDLPRPLHELAARAPDSPIRQVQIRQRGEMWLKQGGRAMAFTAVQHFAADRVAFSWKARFPLLGPLALRVVDDYDSGAGALTVSLFGLPLQRQRGPETTRGEALRYLAELPFVPPALLMNRDLEFQEIDDRRVDVAATVAGDRLTMTLELDERGNVVRTSSTMRELKRDGKWRATPWGGEFRDYAQIGPLYLPATGEAYWDLEDGRYVYWRGSITAAELVDEEFQR
jgi:hypothetical protein